MKRTRLQKLAPFFIATSLVAVTLSFLVLGKADESLLVFFGLFFIGLYGTEID